MSYKVNPGWFSKKFYWWYNFLIPHIAHNSIKVLTVSNSSKSDIIKYLGIESDKINVVYNSILTIDNQNFKENELGKYILTISSLDPRKNLNNLIKSFKGIDQEIKLVIVGLKSSNFAKALDEDLIDNNVIIKGYVTDDDLASLMYHAQAFVYVSLYEGFGLPPLEAMAFGCPVIASDIQSLKEICAEAAEYVNPYDVNNIRDKILKVLNDPLLREKLILKGHKNIERFSWSASANKVFNIINEVL
jgi:glycosyltransferase involved in cell wall biosynthesis